MRFMPMGAADSPGIQQGWARIVKKVVNERVLRPLGEQHVLENGLELEPPEVQSAAGGLVAGHGVTGHGVTGHGVQVAASLEQPAERRLVGGGSAAAQVAAMYVDDGKTRHAACFTKEQADAQFAAALAFFDKYGLECSAKKNVWPSAVGSTWGWGWTPRAAWPR